MPPYKLWIRRPPKSGSTKRSEFRALLAEGPQDAASWERALGWAVAEASAFLLNSADEPVLDAIGHHAIEQLVAELF